MSQPSVVRIAALFPPSTPVIGGPDTPLPPAIIIPPVVPPGVVVPPPPCDPDEDPDCEGKPPEVVDLAEPDHYWAFLLLFLGGVWVAERFRVGRWLRP